MSRTFKLLALVAYILLANTLDTDARAAVTCNVPDTNGISTFTIHANSILGSLPFIQIQFDTIRKLAVSSTMLQNELNTQKKFDRLEPFRPYGCPQIPTPMQANCTVGYYMTATQQTISGRTNWDRGHLTPANPMRFSADALNSTFYCVNIAPQDSFTNQKPWRVVEVSVENKIRSTTGLIMTGVCSANNIQDGGTTYRGWVIPKCFWKLVCYRDAKTLVPKVVGFIGENTLTNINDTAGMAERNASTIIPRAQNDILAITNPTLVAQAWTDAFVTLTPGRQITKLPTAAECIAAKTISADTVTEWKAYIR